MATRIPTMYGRYYVISLIWRGRQFTFTAYRANLSKMQRPQAQKLCDKMYPGCRVISFHESDATDGPVVLTTESKDCGEGKYYCREDKKCKPIPMGYHEREDGYLVKNEAANPAQQAAIAIDMKKKGKKPKKETYFYAGETPSVHKDKDQKKKENEKKVRVIVTDGYENASREYTSDAIKQLIEEKTKEGWLILYLGADHDAFKQSRDMGFESAKTLHYSKRDSRDAFKAVATRTSTLYKGSRFDKNEFLAEERTMANKEMYNYEEE